MKTSLGMESLTAAKACHGAIAGLYSDCGDFRTLPWDCTKTTWIAHLMHVVTMCAEHPNITPAELHEFAIKNLIGLSVFEEDEFAACFTRPIPFDKLMGFEQTAYPLIIAICRCIFQDRFKVESTAERSVATDAQ